MTTDRQILDKVIQFKLLVSQLKISSIDDVPTLEELTEKFNSGRATVRDAWVAKLYNQGLKIQQGAINASEMGDLKQLALDMQKRFPSQRRTKAGTEGLSTQIRNINNIFKNKGIDDGISQIYSEDLFKKGFEKQRLYVNALKTAVKNVESGLGIKPQVVSKILDTIPTDEMMRKIFAGIKDIPDQETKRLILLGLFGTRGEQINNIVTDKLMGKDIGRPYYDRKLGIMMGDIELEEGRKRLATKVPFGPFMKDVMDYQYDKATDNGKNLSRSIFSKKINLGTPINRYLFKITGKNNVPVLTAADLVELGRTDIGGFTDLRRMTLSWAAKSLGDVKLASELLTHGSDEALDKSVTRRFYIPDEGTDVNKIRAFTTGMEQNIARILGFNNYQDFINELKVKSYTTETSKLKNFGKKITIVEPETKIVQGNVTQPNLIEQGTDLQDEVKLKNLRNQEEIIDRTKSINEQVQALMADEGLDEEQARAKLGIGDSEVKPLTESELNIKNKAMSFFDKFKKQTREAVGDISQTIDEGVDRLTSKETYSEAAERLLDPNEYIKAGKQLLPLASQLVPKPLKLAAKAGKMLMPGTRLEGSAEVAMEAGDAATRSFREEMQAQIQAKEAAEQMGDIEYDTQQNESQIGDGKLPIEEQMRKFGF